MFDPEQLLAAYEIGLGYQKGDVLKPRAGASPSTWGVIQDMVVVLKQNALMPHKYAVIGEREHPETPARRFVNFEINGHDWEKIQYDVLQIHK